MKKALLILLTLTMVLSMMVIAPLGASAEEEKLDFGKVAADYKPEGTAVSTAEEFAAMDPAGKYYLAADIKLEATYAQDFTGTFDGNGKTVTTSVPMFDAFDGIAKNLTIEGSILENVGSPTSEKYVGAFANIAGHTAAVEITNVCNKATVTSSVGGMGGLIGMASNDEAFPITLTRCANYGSIVGGVQANQDNGGLIGCYDGDDNLGENGDDSYVLRFIDCANYGIINAGGRPGGIIGYANSSTKFVDCYNSGEIQSTYNYCGGIAGRIGTDSKGKNVYYFENCVNEGNVIVFKSQGGGIVGWSGETLKNTFKNCINKGAVYGKTPTSQSYRHGGILGNSDYDSKEHVFEGCVNYGKIGDGTNYTKYENYAGGIAGKVSGRTDVRFVDCINYGDISAYGNAGGISGWTKDFGQNTVYERCGNNGDVTSAKTAGGITAYEYAGEDGPSVKYCFNSGNIKGTTDVAGLVAYMNCWSGAEFKYNIVAGTLTGGGSTAVADGGEVKQGKPYEFIGSDGLSHYFRAPENGTVAISGNTVTFTSTDFLMTVEDLPADKAVTKGNRYTFDFSGITYALYAGKTGTVAISGDATTGPVIVLTDEDGKTYDLGAIKWQVSADGKTLELPVYNQSTDVLALFFSNASNVNFPDIDKNFISDKIGGLDYLTGFSYQWSAIGGTHDGIGEGTRTSAADFESGKITYELNKMIGKDVFYQNLDPAIFVVDKYPTTDASHAKVVLSGGVYTNALFDMNDNGTTPPTGDATIYVVATLAVSAIALTVFAIAKKKKVND